MKKNVFAVCDLEVDYALNFMEYLNQKRNIPFEIQAFTTVDSLTAYGEKVHIELLLISGKAMCQRVPGIGYWKDHNSVGRCTSTRIRSISKCVQVPVFSQCDQGSDGMLWRRKGS
ncbi:MAG: hypothetical protein V8Q83_03325 [Blautia sp.]